jgi:AcrR family transcriptional regulator
MASRVPQRADAQRNRERLLAAAETAFNAQGAGASPGDVAKAAGVGNATLYRHFPTRAKLLEAVYDHRIAELCVAAAELAQPAAPARALHEWLRAVVAHVTDRRVLADAFLALYEGPADIEPPQFAAWHHALCDAGHPLLVAAQDAGTARRDVDIAELLALVTGVARAGSRPRPNASSASCSRGSCHAYLISTFALPGERNSRPLTRRQTAPAGREDRETSHTRR